MVNVPGIDDPVTIGTCVVETSAMTCTFNDEIDRVRALGFDQQKGSGSILLIAAKDTTAETVQMNLNGNPTQVDLPAPGGIGVRPAVNWRPMSFGKSATPLGAQSTIIPWTIQFNIAEVNEKRTAVGLPTIPTDGTVSTITFTDTLGVGQVYPAQISFYAWPSTGSRTLADTTTTASAIANHEITSTLDATGRTAVFSVTAPFSETTNYLIAYSAMVADADGNTTAPDGSRLKVTPGFHYTNAVKLDGTDAQVSFSRYYAESFDIDITLNGGFGGLRVSKVITGDAGVLVPAGSTFPIVVDYTLPAGTTADDFGSWVAPGTLNADRTGGTFTFTVKPGAPTTWPGTLPVGTTVSLFEDLAGAADADGVELIERGLTWAAPVFDVDGTLTDTATVGDGTYLKVVLMNEALEAGSFAIAKEVSGAGSAADGKEFTFNFNCLTPTGVEPEGTMTVVAGAAPKSGPRLPVGTTCEISEDVALAQLDGYTLTAPKAQTVTINSRTDAALVTFENVYVAKPKPVDSAQGTTTVTAGKTSSNSTVLSKTGADTFAIVAVGVFMAAAGGTMIGLRHRKSRTQDQ